MTTKPSALRRRFGAASGDEDDEDDDERASEASERASERASDASEEASAGPPPRAIVPRRFPALERTIRDAIDRLGGFVAPKLTWSSPKDATWMATRKSTKCANPGEVTLLLKASDAIAHDLCDAYACCADRHSLFLSPEAERRRLRGDAELHLLAWRELNPSMEFRCFVRRGTLRGVCQRDCANFYPFLPDRVDRLTDLLAEFWQDVVYRLPSDSLCRRVRHGAEKVQLVDVNPWGGATLPLMFHWSEFGTGRGGSEGAGPRGRATGRSDPGSPAASTFVVARGHVRPAPASRHVPVVDRSPDGALARAPRGGERRRRGGRDDERERGGAWSVQSSGEEADFIIRERQLQTRTLVRAFGALSLARWGRGLDVPPPSSGTRRLGSARLTSNPARSTSPSTSGSVRPAGARTARR